MSTQKRDSKKKSTSDESVNSFGRYSIGYVWEVIQERTTWPNEDKL